MALAIGDSVGHLALLNACGEPVRLWGVLDAAGCTARPSG
jgi:hypothetical protein